MRPRERDGEAPGGESGGPTDDHLAGGAVASDGNDWPADAAEFVIWRYPAPGARHSVRVVESLALGELFAAAPRRGLDGRPRLVRPDDVLLRSDRPRLADILGELTSDPAGRLVIWRDRYGRVSEAPLLTMGEQRALVLSRKTRTYPADRSSYVEGWVRSRGAAPKWIERTDILARVAVPTLVETIRAAGHG